MLLTTQNPTLKHKYSRKEKTSHRYSFDYRERVSRIAALGQNDKKISYSVIFKGRARILKVKSNYKNDLNILSSIVCVRN